MPGLTSQINPIPAARVIARDADWTLNEFVCEAGPQDRPFEERHASVAIAAVLEGSFQYRCDSGRALLYPGAVMLGNFGACYECGHDHGSGDRCVSLQFSPALFEEIAASTAGSSRFRFTAAMLPALKSLYRPMAEMAALAANTQTPNRMTPNHMAVEELAIDMAEAVVEAVAGGNARSVLPSAADSRRISRVLRHIEVHAAEPLDLAGLAAVACMSKYHFLRSFRRITGVTPHQYLLGLRLHRAAERLCSSNDPVSAIAWDAGFGDLSTFNAGFRARFGASPGNFRSAHGRLIAA
ncbi:helix-turn-helix domain-containing protein [Ferrovibrio sp.]|uniref:helix-turn-helix domain-containing protein n=1 Tax=Ferrovibrio sp. TaxID=1917215 RepID=UPI000CA8D99A|nr:AraC family transcriptional regulator [Ferrovibrio sp.]PJI42438.1 MAG: AraC family transcriptional regulator [Ferrovibrio sp.]